jgi:hypothetical protein
VGGGWYELSWVGGGERTYLLIVRLLRWEPKRPCMRRMGGWGGELEGGSWRVYSSATVSRCVGELEKQRREGARGTRGLNMRAIITGQLVDAMSWMVERIVRCQGILQSASHLQRSLRA